MSKKLFDWIVQQKEYSEYLSKGENWTPMLRHIARGFLITGAILGWGLGVWTTLLILWGLR